MRMGAYIALIGLVLLSHGCSNEKHLQAGEVIVTEPGRWNAANIDEGCFITLLDDEFSKLPDIIGEPISMDAITLEPHKSMNLVIFEHTNERTDILFGRTGEETPAIGTFDSAGPSGSLVLQNGFGYVVGGWRLARGRHVRATGHSIRPEASATHAAPITTDYDRGAHILYVCKPGVDRVFAIQREWDLDRGTAWPPMRLHEDECVDIDPVDGKVLGGPYKFDCDDIDYCIARKVAESRAITPKKCE